MGEVTHELSSNLPPVTLKEAEEQENSQNPLLSSVMEPSSASQRCTNNMYKK